MAAPLIELLNSKQFSKFESPLTNIIHNLLNLPLSQSKALLFPEPEPSTIVDQIITLIDNTIPQDTESIENSSLDENLSPVFALLCTITDISPAQVKQSMKTRLLPAERYPLPLLLLHMLLSGLTVATAPSH